MLELKPLKVKTSNNEEVKIVLNIMEIYGYKIHRGSKTVNEYLREYPVHSSWLIIKCALDSDGTKYSTGSTEKFDYLTFRQFIEKYGQQNLF